MALENAFFYRRIGLSIEGVLASTPEGRPLGKGYTMKSRKRSLPEWISKILRVRDRLGLNQAEFAARLNYSAMALFRREHGSHEPSAEAYIQMSNVAGEPEASWFWNPSPVRVSIAA